MCVIGLKHLVRKIVLDIFYCISWKGIALKHFTRHRHKMSWNELCEMNKSIKHILLTLSLFANHKWNFDDLFASIFPDHNCVHNYTAYKHYIKTCKTYQSKWWFSSLFACNTCILHSKTEIVFFLQFSLYVYWYTVCIFIFSHV